MKPTANLNKLPLTNFEKQLNWLAVAGVLIHLLLITLNYSRLPDQIPIHFDFSGTPDNYGSKGTIWILAVLAIAMYFFMRFIASLSADQYNYPVKITPANAKQQYLVGRQLIYLLNVGMAYLFLLISWGIIQTAKGSTDGLGVWFFLALLFLIFGPIAYSLHVAKKTT